MSFGALSREIKVALAKGSAMAKTAMCSGEGGILPEDTPAAIVYKATWADEKKYICTVGTLARTAAEHNITKTALMIIGDAVKTSDYQRSKLYDPGFTTEFRKASE